MNCFSAQANENGNVALSGSCFTMCWFEINGTAIINPCTHKSFMCGNSGNRQLADWLLNGVWIRSAALVTISYSASDGLPPIQWPELVPDDRKSHHDPAMNKLTMIVLQEKSGERMKTGKDDLMFNVVRCIGQPQPATNTD